MPRTFESEFRSYDNGEAFRELQRRLPKWVDMSWHNDSCPCLENGKWTLWVDFQDKEKREAKGKMFTVIAEHAPEISLETDSLEEAVKFCLELEKTV